MNDKAVFESIHNDIKVFTTGELTDKCSVLFEIVSLKLEKSNALKHEGLTINYSVKDVVNVLAMFFEHYTEDNDEPYNLLSNICSMYVKDKFINTFSKADVKAAFDREIERINIKTGVITNE